MTPVSIHRVFQNFPLIRLFRNLIYFNEQYVHVRTLAMYALHNRPTSSWISTATESFHSTQTLAPKAYRAVVYARPLLGERVYYFTRPTSWLQAWGVPRELR